MPDKSARTDGLARKTKEKRSESPESEVSEGITSFQ